MADVVDWYIVPMVNVDGYAFTFTGGVVSKKVWNACIQYLVLLTIQEERLWRKTRSPGCNLEAGDLCHGVDANRNWGYKWGGNYV